MPAASLAPMFLFLASFCLKLQENTWCENTAGSYLCVCKEGFLGNGLVCEAKSFAVRTVISVGGEGDQKVSFPTIWGDVRAVYTNILTTGENVVSNSSTQLASSALPLLDPYSPTTIATLYAFFATQEEAMTAAQRLVVHGGLASNLSSAIALAVTQLDPPFVAAFDADLFYLQQSDLSIKPSGLVIDDVTFDFNCQPRECWVIDFSYTRGPNAAMNVLFLPRTQGTLDAASGTWVYSDAELATFQSQSFPCSSSSSSDALQPSACCLLPFAA
eukprot:1909915-Rhodomonas_salina.1